VWKKPHRVWVVAIKFPIFFFFARPVGSHRFDGVEIMSVTVAQAATVNITFVKTVVEIEGVRAISLLDTSKWVTILGISTKELTLNFVGNEVRVQVKRVKCPLQHVVKKQLRSKVFSSVRNYLMRGEEMRSMLNEAVYENIEIRRKFHGYTVHQQYSAL
jgi:hypothetical protein